MILPLEDSYRLASYRYGWKLQAREVAGADAKTPGEERWETIGYYAKVGQALPALVDYDLRQSDCQSLTDALAHVERLSQALTDALAPHIHLDLEET